MLFTGMCRLSRATSAAKRAARRFSTSSTSGPKGPAGNLDRILARVFGVGIDIAVRLVGRPEYQSISGAFGAECLDIPDIENQLDGCVAAALAICGLMQLNVAAAILRAQLADPMTRQLHGIEA